MGATQMSLTHVRDVPPFLSPESRNVAAAEQRASKSRVQSMLSTAQSKLEEFMPARTAPHPPPDVNPFQQAIDDYGRAKEALAETTLERDDLRDKLLSSYHRCEALEARLEGEGAFYRQQIEQLRAERDAFARTCVEMASANDAVSEAAGQVAKLALRSREIVTTYRTHLREARETPDEVAGQVDGMTAPIAAVVDRLPKNAFE